MSFYRYSLDMTRRISCYSINNTPKNDVYLIPMVTSLGDAIIELVLNKGARDSNISFS